MQKTRVIRDLFVAVVIFALPSQVLAEPGKGKGKGGGAQKHNRAPAIQEPASVHLDIRIGGEARAEVQDYYRSTTHCPPGLAKKNNGCSPPGQAKKRYQVGRVLQPDLRDHGLPPVLHRRLPPPPEGYIYRHVDGDVLLVAEATHRVVDAVVAVNAAINALGH